MIDQIIAKLQDAAPEIFEAAIAKNNTGGRTVLSFDYEGPRWEFGIELVVWLLVDYVQGGDAGEKLPRYLFNGCVINGGWYRNNGDEAASINDLELNRLSGALGIAMNNLKIEA